MYFCSSIVIAVVCFCYFTANKDFRIHNEQPSSGRLLRLSSHETGGLILPSTKLSITILDMLYDVFAGAVSFRSVVGAVRVSYGGPRNSLLGVTLSVDSTRPSVADTATVGKL